MRRNIPKRQRFGCSANSISPPLQLTGNSILSNTCLRIIERYEDACLSIPSSSLLKAPRIRQRKRGPLLSLSLSLSPRCLYVFLPLSPALCSSLSADAPKLQQQLFTGNKFEKSSPPRGCERRRWTTHLRVVFCCARVAVRRGEKFERAHLALCCGVPLCLHV